jgi:cysteinyl-tRNA synthetase
MSLAGNARRRYNCAAIGTFAGRRRLALREKAVLLYDTRTRRKERFVAEREPVSIYVCGITPYDTTHLGHAFTYVFYDTLIRYLRYQGHQTLYVQNVTDVDDDIMRKSRELGMRWDQLADEQTRIFQQDMAALNILAPDVYPHASQEIDKILEINQNLVNSGYAYQSDGSLYFSVNRYARYGELSHLPRAGMLPIANERGNNPNDPLKRDPLDFVLWQKSLPDEPAWESPWGPGRPGWHIECSAMSLHYLGDTVDIHGGGEDLVFPHHENEIAQSENFTGVHPFVRYWVHTAMVYMGGQKMSKSLGNLVMVRVLRQQYDPAAIRLALLSHIHTERWSYSEEEMVEAAKLLEVFRQAAEGEVESPPLPAGETEDGGLFLEAMDDDLDTPRAIGVLTEMAQNIRFGGKEPGMTTPQCRALFKGLVGVLGIQL